MERVPVESTAIRSIGYAPATATLEVEFQNGGIYQYFDVQPDAYQEFMSASSKGAHFVQNIQSAGYRYSKLR